MKKTYGQKLLDHWNKNEQLEDDPIEYRKKLELDVIKEIDNVITNSKNQAIYKNKDFYIVMLIKVEKIGSVPRTFIFARRSCPTPVYKQAVWKYHYESGSLEFFWSIPDSILYHHILHNAEKYLNDPETAILAKFVVLMDTGELLKYVKKENGEKKDAVILTKEDTCQTN